MLVAFDASRLYIAADMQDRQPERIVANVMHRDAELLNNDSFEIYLDTYHDHRNLFYSGKLTALGGGLTLRPNANFSLETQYSRNNIALPIPRGKYATNLAISRLTYSFTPRLFAKVFVQYQPGCGGYNKLLTMSINFCIFSSL